ncbi:WXG100 family type VII secretion target [Nocardia salmonicida]|uniref:WXG100 family type VII secretion target n=1 Tax=Nocardia salmonicida TaxID=53431 RepID=UPI0033E725CA
MAQSWDGKFDVVPTGVADAGRYIQLTAQELVSGLSAIDSDVNNLLETWTGNSATSYRSGWDEARKGAEAVLSSLATLAELLGVVADTHTDLDTERAAETSSLDLP